MDSFHIPSGALFKVSSQVYQKSAKKRIFPQFQAYMPTLSICCSHMICGQSLLFPALRFVITTLLYRTFFSVWKVFSGRFSTQFFRAFMEKLEKTQLCVHVCGWYFIPFSPAPVQLFGGRSFESVNQDDKWSPIFQSASALLEQMVSINNQLYLKCFVSIKHKLCDFEGFEKPIPVVVSIWHYVPYDITFLARKSADLAHSQRDS